MIRHTLLRLSLLECGVTIMLYLVVFADSPWLWCVWAGSTRLSTRQQTPSSAHAAEFCSSHCKE